MKPLETNPTRVIYLSQCEIALNQLDRAVMLFLQEGDFVSSVTLACAAEGVFGEHLKDIGIIPHAEELKSILKEKFAPDLSLKQINDEYVNRARNFYKHKTNDIHERVEFETETEAISAIIRATYNSVLVTGNLPESVIEFLKWLNINRPDITTVSKEIASLLD